MTLRDFMLEASWVRDLREHRERLSVISVCAGCHRPLACCDCRLQRLKRELVEQTLAKRSEHQGSTRCSACNEKCDDMRVHLALHCALACEDAVLTASHELAKKNRRDGARDV